MPEQRIGLILYTQGQEKFDKAAASIGKVEKAANKIQGTGGKVGRAFNEIGNSGAQAAQKLDGLKSNIGGVIAKFAALATAAVSVGTSINAAFERENAEKRLQNLTSSAAEYEQSLRLAKIASADFGVTQTEATKALGDTLSRLKGVGYGLTEVNDIYTGFNVIARQSGVAAEDAAGAFLQLGQALGSGKLQGDELRAILERMPQLAQAIASEMGIAAGEVRQAGADGKITGEVMLAALTKAAQGADNLNDKLTKNQLTQAQLKQRTEELQVALGKTLAPAYLTILEGMAGAATVLAGAFNKLNGFVEENKEQLTAILKVGLEIGKLAAAVFIVAKAYAVWQKAVAAVAAAKAFLVGLTGKGLVLVAAGAAAAAATYVALGGAVDGVVKEIEDLGTKSKKELEGIRKKAKENEDAFRGVKKSTEETKQATAELGNSVKDLTAKYSKLNEAQSQRNSQFREFAAAEKTLAGLVLQGERQVLEHRLKSARSLSEQRAIKDQLLTNTIKAAEAERDHALLMNEQSIIEAQFQQKLLVAKAKELEIQVAIAEAKGADVTKQKEAVTAAYEAADAHKQVLDHATKMKGINDKIAETTYKNAVNAAKFADEEERGANAAQRMQQALGRLPGIQSRPVIEQVAALTTQQWELLNAYTRKIAGEFEGLQVAVNGTSRTVSGSRYEVEQFNQRVERMRSKIAEGTYSIEGLGNASQNAASALNTAARQIAAATTESFQPGTKSRGSFEAYGANSKQGRALMQSGYGMKTEEGLVTYNPDKVKYLRPEKFQALGYAVDEGRDFNSGPRDYFAAGGYIRKGEVGIVGEKGPELVEGPAMVTSNPRLKAAMAQGGGGGGEGSMVQVTYNGDTINFDGQQYIRKADVGGMINAAVTQVQKRMAGSPKYRLEAGVA